MSEEDTDDLGDPINEAKPEVEPKGASLDGRPIKKKHKGKYPRKTRAVDIYMNPVKKKVGQKCIFYNMTNLEFPEYCRWSTARRRCRIRKDWTKPIVLTKEGRCPYQRVRIVKRNIKAKDEHGSL